MNTRKPHRPLALVIIDGWGYREDAPDNAISQARTPCWDRLWSNGPCGLLETSGAAVGLPEGQMGNSEVGHMNIGAGRIVYQDYTRITKAIEDGSFFDNQALGHAIDAAQSSGSTVHIMGLLSPGGVHSHDDHFLATVELARRKGAAQIVVHAFLDGRDTPPRSAMASIRRMQHALDQVPGARFGTLAGRYYAMDRDQRWERVERAWSALVDGTAEHRYPNAEQALEAAYLREENDEFVVPTIIDTYPGIRDGDSVLFINFRADRARQLSRAFAEPGFEGFERGDLRLAAFATMTEYMRGLDADVAFPNEALTGLLGEVLAANGLRQLRIAETEKYAHVTFFFNGGREEPYDLEERILIPSPKVATYDLKPEMSAPQLADALDTAIRTEKFDVIICNIANPDMVGHSGQIEAAVLAVEAVDACLARIEEALEAVGGELIITADHGNVEQMQDERSGQVHTAHTTNPVPFVFSGRPAVAKKSGSLRDIAPTMLYLLGIEPPGVMTGSSLLRLQGGSGNDA